MSEVKRNGIDVSFLDHKIYFLKYPFLKLSVKEDITTQHVQVHRDYSVKKACLLVPTYSQLSAASRLGLAFWLSSALSGLHLHSDSCLFCHQGSLFLKLNSTLSPLPVLSGSKRDMNLIVLDPIPCIFIKSLDA